MKTITPCVELWEQPQTDNPVDMFKHIERCGRICYKSDDKITDTSYEKFINMLDNYKHRSVFEHGTVYITIPIGSPMYDTNYSNKTDIVHYFYRNPYSTVQRITYHLYKDVKDKKLQEFFLEVNGPIDVYYITTNYRVLVENTFYSSLGYHNTSKCKSFKELLTPYCSGIPSKHHEKRITVHWTSSRAIMDEFLRHRVMSPSAESTRYCNYSKGKFGVSVSFVLPTNDLPEEAQTEFIKAYSDAEQYYFKLLSLGVKPQNARDVLPFGLKAEYVMTGTYKQWNDFLVLRTDSGAHPDAIHLAKQLENLLFV